MSEYKTRDMKLRLSFLKDEKEKEEEENKWRWWRQPVRWNSYYKALWLKYDLNFFRSSYFSFMPRHVFVRV